MEQNQPVATKKLLNLVRVMLFMIRKNLSKTKLLLDLQLMIKLGKIAGKALHNFMLHRFDGQHGSYKTNSEKNPGMNDDHDEIFVDLEVIKALEMLTSAAASPAFPGFGKSPMVRQLRITDSPFPLSNEEEDSYVDEAAERFIIKFYADLRRQS